MKKNKVLIWGTGSASKEFLDKIDLNKVEIVAVLDSYSETRGYFQEKYKLLAKEEIHDYQFEYIIIATIYSEEVYGILKNLNVQDEKILFLHNYKKIEKIKKLRNKKIINNLTRKILLDYKKINLVSISKSGCNCKALFKNIPQNIREKYKVTLTNGSVDKEDDSGTIISTHFNGIYDGRINIDLWHGFGVKNSGRLNSKDNNEEKEFIKNIDLFVTYSKLATLAMVTMLDSDPIKYKEVGYPRNDLLFENLSLKKLLGIEDYKKIILYMPTFRDGEDVKEINDLNKIKNKLEKENAILIIKDHMYSKRIYTGIDNKLIYDLSKSEFKVDFYEYLNDIDCLVTDYSSIYFDLLLLDKKMIFMIDDIAKYNSNRGFLLEPYEAWVPGPMVKNWEEALSEFVKEDKYINKRKILRDISHRHKDNKSCERVWEEIDGLISNKINNKKEE